MLLLSFFFGLSCCMYIVGCVLCIFSYFISELIDLENYFWECQRRNIHAAIKIMLYGGKTMTIWLCSGMRVAQSYVVPYRQMRVYIHLCTVHCVLRYMHARISVCGVVAVNIYVEIDIRIACSMGIILYVTIRAMRKTSTCLCTAHV